MGKRLVRLGVIALVVMMLGPAVWAMVKPALTALVMIVAPVVTALYVFPATRPLVVRHGLRVGRRVLLLGKRWGRRGVRAVWR